MYKLSIELLRMLADKLQTGAGSPNCKVAARRGDKQGGYEDFFFDMPDVKRISVDRRRNMAADQLEVELHNTNGRLSPDYSPFKMFENVKGLRHSGYSGVIMPFNRVECELGYGKELRRMFTGQIQGVNIEEAQTSINFDAKNEFRKLLKPIDPKDTRSLIYEDAKAFDIIFDLCIRAGVKESVILFEADEIGEKNFTISGKTEFPIGARYSDAVKSILDIMNHRIYADREGNICVVKKENYQQKDFHNIELKDYVNITSGSYRIDPGVIRNRVIIQSKNGWVAFEDPKLIDFCNGEIISSGLEAPWAETEEQKWTVADNYFLSMRRKLRRISIGTIGNPCIDVGDLVKVEMLTSTATSKYMVTSIQSDFGPDGYFEKLDLEFVADWDGGHLCVKAEGEYKAPEPEPEPTQEEPVKDDVSVTVEMTLRDRIVDYAKSFLGIYYQWGGNYPQSGYGVDCSHFTYQVFKKFGFMSSYMVARGQYGFCNSITVDELKPGDLVFYKNNAGRVYHVVMYIGNGQIIGSNGGGPSTTSRGVAQKQNAKVKIESYKKRAGGYYGRVPGLT